MKNEQSIKSISKAFAMISIGISSIMIALILSNIFKIMPNQNSGALVLFITPFVCVIGGILGSVSVKMQSNKLAKGGIINNAIAMILAMAIISTAF